MSLLPIFQEICLFPKAFPSSHFMPAGSSLHVVFLGSMATIIFLFYMPASPDKLCEPRTHAVLPFKPDAILAAEPQFP